MVDSISASQYYTASQGLIKDNLTVVQAAYDKDIEALQKVYDAKTHLIDQEANSVVGFRKRMEEAAAAFVLTTDSISGGLMAGWDTIMSHIQSTTESVRDFVVGVWGSMSTAFDTGFYDILTGKFSDLGNVLKNLWDSILKDFSKMLTQMLERWLLTGNAMGSGQGGGGVLGGLLGGGGGSNAVETPQGTGAEYGQGAGYGGGQWGAGLGGGGAAGAGYGGGGTGGGSGLGAGQYLGYAGAAVGIYMGIQGALKQNKQQVSYGDVNLGEMNFGGDSYGQKLTPWLAAAASVAATGIGLVVAAVIAVVGIIVSLFNGPKEGHVTIAIRDALSGSGGALSKYVTDVIDGTANYVGELALKAAGPDKVAGFVTAYQTAFKDAYGAATFDIAAGSAEDLQKDLTNYFEQVLPKMGMQAAFGQVGYGPNGNRDAQGGVAGLDWNMNDASVMDAQGNWVKHQLFDPNAPIPMMLTGLGFTADSISAIAQKLADATDMKVFKQWLLDLVGVVVDLQALATAFGQTRDQWYASIHGAAAAQGTAGQFTDANANLLAGGELLATIFGDDRVAAAKALVTEGQTLLNNEAQALANILGFIDQIATTTASTIQTYQSKLLTPSENEAALRARATTDFAAIAEAANPKDVAAAWQKVLGDMTGLLDIIVARIQAIQALQQSYADFRTLMATNAGPQFGTDPQGWLAANQKAIDAIDFSDPIKGATTLLDLEKTRYSNLSTMLQNVDAAIKSIDATSLSAIQNLTMQGMGSVTTDATGKQTWTPDVHAQGDYLNAQYQSLMGQLSKATTPEQITSLMGQINSIINQLAGQPQDAAHYKESRDILIQMQKDAQAAADKLLGTMHDSLTADLKGIGDQLKAGETALAKALSDSQWDFTQALHNLGLASDAATLKLNGYSDALVTQMGLLVAKIEEWILLFTTTPTGAPSTTPVVVPNPRPRTNPTDAPNAPVVPPINVTVNVASGTPEDIAQAASASTYKLVLAVVKAGNTELVRVLRNNPQVLVR